MTCKPMVSDGRYNISLEFTGAPKQQHVVRFCGDFVSAHDGRGLAEIAALQHAIDRGQLRSEWELVVKTGSVIWMKKGKKHRVAYGADVREFKDSFEASRCSGI